MLAEGVQLAVRLTIKLLLGKLNLILIGFRSGKSNAGGGNILAHDIIEVRNKSNL
jgi:hypothetical protein